MTIFIGPIKERVHEPTPEEVRTARENAGLSPDGAGALVSAAALPRRTWEKWEKPEGTVNFRNMPIATWELFLLLTDQHPTLKLTKRRG